MFKFVILSFVACAFGAAIPEGFLQQQDGRIVNGNDTAITSHPWMVSLQRNGVHSCGASIYNAKIIVTAAHCLQSVSISSLQIRAGSIYWNSGGVVIGVAAFRCHPSYVPSTMVNDIAVVRLSSSLAYSNNIKAIPLTSSNYGTGYTASITGWGISSSDSNSLVTQLQFARVNIIAQALCASATYGYNTTVKNGMICAAAKDIDACLGDSGGPLVTNGLLIGVVSWGYGCALPYYPRVYTNIYTYHDWIENAANST